MAEPPNVECAICANEFTNGQNYAECPNHDIECERCVRTQSPIEIGRLENKLAADTWRLEMVEQVAAAGDTGAGILNDDPGILRKTIAETTKLLEDIRERAGLVCTFCLQRMEVKRMNPANLQRLKLIAVKNEREVLRKLYADRGNTPAELEAEYERRGLQPHQQQQPQGQAMSLQISEEPNRRNQGAAAAVYVPPGRQPQLESDTEAAIQASLQTVEEDDARRRRKYQGNQGNGAAAVQRVQQREWSQSDADMEAAIQESLQTTDADADLEEAIRMSMQEPAAAAAARQQVDAAAAADAQYVQPGVARARYVQQLNAASDELAELVSRPMRQISAQQEQLIPTTPDAIRELLQQNPTTAAAALKQQQHFTALKSFYEQSAAAKSASANAADDFARKNFLMFPNLAAYAKQTAMDTRLAASLDIALAGSMRPPAARWVPDEEATHCCSDVCKSQFGLINRKHHCRGCGKIFCSSCCTGKGDDKKCHNCFKMPYDGRPPAQPSKRGGYKKSRKSKLSKMSRKSKLSKMSRKSKLSKMSRKSNLPKKSRKSKLSKMSRKK